MTALISYPFRLDSRGYAVVREDDTDGYYAEELANLIQTKPGERTLRPAYGVDDPAFRSRFPTAEMTMKASVYGPPVKIKDVKVNFVRDGVADVTVEFDNAIN